MTWSWKSLCRTAAGWRARHKSAKGWKLFWPSSGICENFWASVDSKVFDKKIHATFTIGKVKSSRLLARSTRLTLCNFSVSERQSTHTRKFAQSSWLSSFHTVLHQIYFISPSSVSHHPGGVSSPQVLAFRTEEHAPKISDITFRGRSCTSQRLPPSSE